MSVAKQYSSTPGVGGDRLAHGAPSVTAPIASATTLEQLDTLIASDPFEARCCREIAKLDQASA